MRARVRARACNFSNDNDDTTLYSHPSLFGKMCFLSLRHENLNWLQIISILPSFGEHFWKVKLLCASTHFAFAHARREKSGGHAESEAQEQQKALFRPFVGFVRTVAIKKQQSKQKHKRSREEEERDE